MYLQLQVDWDAAPVLGPERRPVTGAGAALPEPLSRDTGTLAELEKGLVGEMKQTKEGRRGKRVRPSVSPSKTDSQWSRLIMAPRVVCRRDLLSRRNLRKYREYREQSKQRNQRKSKSDPQAPTEQSGRQESAMIEGGGYRSNAGRGGCGIRQSAISGRRVRRGAGTQSPAAATRSSRTAFGEERCLGHRRRAGAQETEARCCARREQCGLASRKGLRGSRRSGRRDRCRNGDGQRTESAPELERRLREERLQSLKESHGIRGTRRPPRKRGMHRTGGERKRCLVPSKKEVIDSVSLKLGLHPRRKDQGGGVGGEEFSIAQTSLTSILYTENIYI